MLRLETDSRGLARVTLARPDKHNAFDAATILELTRTFATLGEDEAVRAILLTGEGPSFCAGGDAQWMRESASLSEEENRADAMRLSDMLATIDNCPKPVMAIAHGNVFGGGVGLIACADMVAVKPGARFRLSEVRLGLTPSTISPFLVAKMGASSARRYFLTAEDFGPADAIAIGLAHVETDDPEAQVESWFAHLRLGAPGAIAEAKGLVRDVAGRAISFSLRSDTADRIAARRASAEGREGLTAFLEKRKPDWANS
ncbi:enoyl-CoA hydratase-related protein [Sandaracinobacter sp. RS1-74]|uniref:enoyl-CoA hydratase-related protein n=1 Tax=Sandaracinobacteroides sayramensis TaxID=2913411 RepID=UPI001EDBEA1A|nr:enoyl-CoA hydratase-related protein [Sandaracinobacteroides sayramensis]MCG2841643.1 enoyl-CoA hydratase-related protein [Sandaracinobacteroides sayramensis]